MVKLSVIIVNYRGWEPLKRCLHSLSCLDMAIYDSEIVVVDNCSSDGKFESFSRLFPTVKFVENTGNFGFSNGNNLGFRNSNGKYILFLNPDTEISLSALNLMLEYIEGHDESKIVSCQQENEAGREENPYGVFPSLKSLNGLSRAIFRLFNSKDKLKVHCNDQSVIYPDWVSGSLILMKRDIFQLVGGWSEDYFMYYEDVDLCKKVSDLGSKVALLCNARIMHQHGGLTRKNSKQTAFFKTEVLKSQHIYISKHFDGFKKCLMQTILVFNNLVLERLLPALLGLIFFFEPKLRTQLFVYFNLLGYYLKAISRRSWIVGPRTVNFAKD
ncbi:MAG: glycosyltransferase family 2 protein [Bacteroidales bacterium]|nr:glycosyltransferase family 2 protein [Bacteroidales bacterium]